MPKFSPELTKNRAVRSRAPVWPPRRCRLLALGLLATLPGIPQPSAGLAQRPQFSDPFVVQQPVQAGFGQPATFQGTIQNPQFVQQGGLPPLIQGAPPSITTTPPPAFIPSQFPQGSVPQGTILQGGGVAGPAFDPFSTGNNPWPIQPGVAGSQNGPFLPALGTPPPVMSFDNSAGFGNSYLQNYPQTGGAASATSWPAQFWSRLRTDTIPRLLERPRWRNTWLEGDDGTELDILESEIATTLTFPGPLNPRNALRVSPGFVFLFLDGPDTAMTGFDLPGQLYSAYTAFDANSDTSLQAGFDINVTLGVYTDFHHVSSDSLRLTGTGLGWIRVNPYTVFKLGVEYFDRIDLKLLPAFGFFMQPNNEMRMDLYFPRPRVSHRLPSLGNYDIWGYVGAEVGGGSWTMERIFGVDDQVDINDIRAFIGYEWTGPRKVTGFIEGGYVFDRELLYKSAPAIKLEIPDTFMIRTGLAF
jgi:hypothetical protein